MSIADLKQISSSWEAEGYRTVNAAQVASSLATIEMVGDLIIPGASFADIGCGAGEVAAAMSNRGLAVLAVDGAASMVAASKKLCIGSDAVIEQQDVNRLDLRGARFDVVHSSWVLHWLHDLESALDAMCASVAEGGALVLQWSRAFPLEEGTGLVGVFQDLAASDKWRDRLGTTPILSYQHPVETVERIVTRAGLHITHLNTRLWPDATPSQEPGQETIDAVVNSLRHTGFGRQHEHLGASELREFLEEGVRSAIARQATDPRDARLIATRPRS